MKSKTIIDSKTAARILGVSARRIYQYIEDGRLPTEGKFNNSYMIDQSALDFVLIKHVGRPPKPIPSQLYQEILKKMDRLDPLEQEIITLRFGLDGEPRRTLAQIGRFKTMAKGSIHFIYQRAIRKIKELE